MIANLLESPRTFAVIGVSQETTRYGYELFEMLTRHGHRVLPVNPKYQTIDGQTCYPSLADLPEMPDAVVTAVPPSVCAQIAETCARLKTPILWMPPGTSSEEAIEICRQKNVNHIRDICPAFVLRMPRERWVELP